MNYIQIIESVTMVIFPLSNRNSSIIFSVSNNPNSDELAIIKLLIGEQKYNELFLENGVLSGYNDLEGTIILNGTEVSTSELNQIINLIQNGEINIQDVIVE